MYAGLLGLLFSSSFVIVVRYEPPLGLELEGLREVLLVVVEGVDVDSDLGAGRNDVAVDDPRLGLRAVMLAAATACRAGV